MTQGNNKSRVFAGLLVGLLMALGLSGCNLGQSQGGVAILDLDAVARDLGRDTAINGKVQAYAKGQEAKLQRLKTELEAKVGAASEQVGSDATPAERASLAGTIASARQELGRELGQTRQSVQELRRKLVREFALEIQPVAQQVAEKRGLTVVMLKQPGLLVVLPQADITAAVIEALHNGKAGVAPALPGKG